MSKWQDATKQKKFFGTVLYKLIFLVLFVLVSCFMYSWIDLLFGPRWNRDIISPDIQCNNEGPIGILELTKENFNGRWTHSEWTIANQVQIARKARILEVCKTDLARNLTNDHGRWSYKNLLVFDKQKIIICKLAKAGSMFWLRLLWAQNGMKTVLPGERDNLEDLSEEEREYKLKTYLKIMVVRDPFTRLWSAYTSKFLNMNFQFIKKYGKFIIEKYRPNYSAEEKDCPFNITFPEFVKYVLWEHEEKRIPNAHWRPYYRTCLPCEVDYDIIATLDTFNADLNLIMRQSRIQNTDSLETSEDSIVEAACRHPLKNATAEDLKMCGKYQIIKQTIINHWTESGFIDPNDETDYITELMSINKTALLSEYNVTDDEGLLEKVAPSRIPWINRCRQMFKNHVDFARKSTVSNIKKRKLAARTAGINSLSRSDLKALLDVYKLDFDLLGYRMSKYKT